MKIKMIQTDAYIFSSVLLLWFMTASVRMVQIPYIEVSFFPQFHVGLIDIINAVLKHQVYADIGSSFSHDSKFNACSTTLMIVLQS